MRQDKGKSEGRRGGFNKRSDSRGFRGGSRDGGFDRGPRKMHKTVCAECHKECEVPFKPTEGKPVYCRECFQKRRH